MLKKITNHKLQLYFYCFGYEINLPNLTKNNFFFLEYEVKILQKTLKAWIRLGILKNTKKTKKII